MQWLICMCDVLTHIFPCYFTGTGALTISMDYCKKDVTPVCKQWNYVFLAQTHRCDWPSTNEMTLRYKGKLYEYQNYNQVQNLCIICNWNTE